MQISIAILVNGNGTNAINYLINNFKTRVAADSGTYSAEDCQNATLTALNNI